MSRSLFMLLLLLGACRYYTPSEAPIHGASDAQEAQIRADLIAFDEAVGVGRTRIGGVWVSDIADGRGGQFRAGTRRIDLDSTYGQRSTLTHELCHALDADEKLWKDPFMEELAEGLFDPSYAYRPTDKVSTRSARKRQGEAFATFCETGALGAWGLSEACPNDPAGSTEVGRFYSEEVWRAFDPVAPLGVDSLPQVQSSTGPLTMLWPTVDPQVLFVVSPRGVSYHDLYTGQAVATEPPLADSNSTSWPAGLLGYSADGYFAGGPGAPFAILQVLSVHHLGTADGRYATLSPDGWSIEGGSCSLAGERVFEADGGIWLQSYDGWVELVR